MSTPLRTVDVARASGYSVQQVRDLERIGVIPPAERLENGYRAYASAHVRTLRAYRALATAVGPVEARRMLAELRTRSAEEAAAAIIAVHARLAAEREETLRARRALQAIRDEAGATEPERDDDAMTITELAAALGVRTSTLRYWEQERLVSPERVTSLRVRRYDLPAIREARVVAALRGAGYGIPAVREVVSAVRDLGDTAEADRALQGRLDRLAARAVALLRAGADLAATIEARHGTLEPDDQVSVPDRRA